MLRPPLHPTWPARRDGAWALRATVVVVLTLAGGAARADRIDELGRSLQRDPSFKVRLEAARFLGMLGQQRGIPYLRRALSDRNPVVRGTVAAALGRIGDRGVRGDLAAMARRDPDAFARDHARAALEALDRGRSASPTPPQAREPITIAVHGGGNRVGAAARPLASRLRQVLEDELRHTPGVSVAEHESATSRSYTIEGAITRLDRRGGGNTVEVTCEVSLVVGTGGGRIVMMTSGNATVEATLAGGFKGSAAAGMELDALREAVKGANENLVSFLDGLR